MPNYQFPHVIIWMTSFALWKIAPNSFTTQASEQIIIKYNFQIHQESTAEGNNVRSYKQTHQRQQ